MAEGEEMPAGDMPFSEVEGGKGGFGGMGASNVKLQYIDDDPESYANIFDNAKTDSSEQDQKRLIASLNALSKYENLEDVVNTEEVLRYFVVHNFVVNGDSYTGSMIHNYYLYEENGQLSMIPWDYNLAYGTFQGGDAASAVNDPIDDVLEDRPMQAWIFSDETYTQQYHQLFETFLDTVECQSIIEETKQLIAPYVEQDPSKFCTYEEFETGVDALKSFCTLRAQSARGQLSGTIPSTSEGQSDDAALVDTGDLNLSDMGTMGNTARWVRGDSTQLDEKGKTFTQAESGNWSEAGEGERSNASSEPGGAKNSEGTRPFGKVQFGTEGQDGTEEGSGESTGTMPPGSGTGDMPQMEQEEAGVSAWLLFAISCFLLLAGIFLAVRYKRSK